MHRLGVHGSPRPACDAEFTVFTEMRHILHCTREQPARARHPHPHSTSHPQTTMHPRATSYLSPAMSAGTPSALTQTSRAALLRVCCNFEHRNDGTGIAEFIIPHFIPLKYRRRRRQFVGLPRSQRARARCRLAPCAGVYRACENLHVNQNLTSKHIRNLHVIRHSKFDDSLGAYRRPREG